jgi:hypothetical protein
VYEKEEFGLLRDRMAAASADDEHTCMIKMCVTMMIGLDPQSESPK